MKKAALFIAFTVGFLSSRAQTQTEKAQALVLADIKKENPIVKGYEFQTLDSLFSDYKTDPLYLSYEARVKDLTKKKKFKEALKIQTEENKFLDHYKGKFIGWKIRCTFSNGNQVFTDIYKFDHDVTKIIGYNDMKLMQ